MYFVWKQYKAYIEYQIIHDVSSTFTEYYASFTLYMIHVTLVVIWQYHFNIYSNWTDRTMCISSIPPSSSVIQELRYTSEQLLFSKI